VVAADVMEAMLALNMMAMQVPPGAPWTAPDAAAWDARTFATWLDTNVTTPGARALLELAIQAVFSAEPRDLSLLHVLFYVRSAGGLMDLIGVTGGAQETRFTTGAQTIANRLAEALGERVILNAPVHAISQDGSGARIESDAVTLTCDRVIVALPPTLAGRLRYRRRCQACATN
jgi:monoamine oxidase